MQRSHCRARVFLLLLSVGSTGASPSFACASVSLALEPSAKAFYLRGRALVKLGQNEQAVADLEQVLRFDQPDLVDPAQKILAKLRWGLVLARQCAVQCAVQCVHVCVCA